MRLVWLWLANAAALLAVTWLVPAIHVTGFGSALIAALGLGLVNTLVRPVLAILTLPFSVVTLGMFYLVLNAALFWLASAFLPGFAVESFFAALVGSVLYGVIAWVLALAIPNKD